MREIINAIENDLGAGPKEIIFNSNFHRFPIKRTDKDGWYVAQTINKNSETHFMCAYGSWKDFEGTKRTWFSWEDDPLEPQKYSALNRQAKKLIKIAEDEKEKEQIQKAKKAENIFSKLETIGESPYLKNKSIPDLFGARLQKDTLVVPIKNSIDKITSLLFIKADGTKRFLAGGKKQGGSFHIGPEIKEKSTVYICEGFATACSVHMATKETTIVAFDSNNLFNVAQLIRQKSPTIRIVICADNDGEKLINNKMKNPGIEAAEKAAKSSNGVMVFPPDSPMDFNDMHMSLGLDSVREVILGAEIKKMPTIRPLGVSEGRFFYFFTSQTNTVLSFGISEFTSTSLTALCADMNYWKSTYPSKRGSYDKEAAIADLISQCSEVGVFDSTRVRKSGVWSDAGKTIINTGYSLYVDGEQINYTDLKSHYVYCVGKQLPQPTSSIDKNQVEEFLSLISQLSWKDKQLAPIYLLGWLFVAPISGSIRWRPHMWITGPAGSGKSWVKQRVVSKILNYAEQAQGTATEASIRQNLSSCSMPVIFDEAEGEDRNSSQRIDNIIEMLRNASDSVTPISKGTPSGKPLNFLVRFSAVLFSIKVGLQFKQDFSRFVCLDMITGNKDNFNAVAPKIDELLTMDFCDQFFSRSVNMLPIFHKNFNVFSKALQSLGTARFADQHGTLLAGYYTALNDDIVSEDMAGFLVNNVFDLEKELEEDAEKDEESCLEYFASSTVLDEYNRHHVIHVMVQNIINDPLNMRSDTETKINILGQNGIVVSKLSKNIGDDYEFVCISCENKAAKKIFSDTSWANKRWHKVLLRLEGAKKGTAKILKRPAKAIKIPIKVFLKE